MTLDINTILWIINLAIIAPISFYCSVKALRKYEDIHLFKVIALLFVSILPFVNLVMIGVSGEIMMPSLIVFRKTEKEKNDVN